MSVSKGGVSVPQHIEKGIRLYALIGLAVRLPLSFVNAPVVNCAWAEVSMKVLIVNTLYPPTVVGGAERSVALLARALRNRGLEVVVATLGTSPHGSVEELDDIEVHRLPLRNLYWPFSDSHPGPMRMAWHALDTLNPIAGLEIERLIRRVRPNVVHTNNLAGFSVAAWAAAWRHRIPLVHTLRDYYLLCPRTTMFRAGRTCERRCMGCRAFDAPRQWLSSVPTAVVGNSNFILERHLAAGYFRGALVRERVFNIDGGTSRSREPKGIGRRPVRFGFIGRIHPSKGVHVMLEAMDQVTPRKWRALIAGTAGSDYGRSLKSRFARSEVEFVDWLEPGTFFERVDVLVVPSLWHDPLPRVIIEAFSHGVPVIGSERGGITELVKDGATGLLFDPERPAALPDAIERFLARPEMIVEMSARCVDAARAFRPETIAAQYEDIYGRVVDLAPYHPVALGRAHGG
jgi:glycosyltransferase involved in cell wall biosynthesis